eukprot:scaffold99003_cov50-Attheya_sp.AAC.2
MMVFAVLSMLVQHQQTSRTGAAATLAGIRCMAFWAGSHGHHIYSIRRSTFHPKLSALSTGNTDADRRETTGSSDDVEIRALIPSSDPYVSEQVIKKSRFIGLAKHCTSWDDAQEFVASVWKEHPKARHVCFGFVAGANPVRERCIDDGEPTGTAGVPILGGIKGEGLSDTVCVVVRYFGGVKLGAGGLIRAYGGTARLVLRESPTEILIPQSTIRLVTSSSNAGSIYDLVNKANGSTGRESYRDNGDFEVTITCESSKLKELQERLQDATRGGVEYITDK